jgi:hypothetical protein
MDRTDRILEIAFGKMAPDQLIAHGATMADVDSANDLVLMDMELEQPTVVPVAPTIATDIIEVLLRRLRGD